ncbi:MAG: cysteine--tRNA ligase [Actinobacteria bacterium]|uniref:Cysteine--tRNA ligase n=1 Tax=freshwater metagenome TaxID=449393 RepID=A0A6J6CDT5_9ZZZZ|nr:cysteine--tRNA ligase [Actinomycetota bacterium]MTA49678.1 cysteine--tRNA ligase [Actinomycetota bacterium]MTA90957.1 cysteine--tRNA ligase [Actinomycetota bacterium]
MNFSIYDTQSREVKPVNVVDRPIHIYCCGPTVYRDAHVGNLRTFLLADLISRTLKLLGQKVILIQNITDVGHMSEDFEEQDKLLSQAKLEKSDPFAIARKYEEKFHADLAHLNIQTADKYPRASETIEGMLSSIQNLIDNESAYVAESGSVYFSAQSFPSYGAISGNRLESLKPGHRYEYSGDGEKRFHADWALWKSAGNRTEMVWESPWGRGFPGWHIECTAMSLDLLAQHIDIHVGGIDLRFPHHENERAQSNSIIGKEAVDLWVHGEHLLFEGRKMSKSANNVVLVADLISQGIDPLALRLALLENRYRSQMDLTWDSLRAANTTLMRWRTAMATWGESQNFLADAEIQTALIEDLDTPRAVLRLRAIEKDQSISPERKREIFNFVDQVFALDLSRKVEVKPLSKEQMDLVQSRANARADKNWAESDRLRDVLAAEGIAVSDGPQGQSWNWIS